MPLSETVLKTALKADLIALYNQAQAGDGVTADAFAESLADAIARNVVTHIKASATVTVTGVMSGPSAATGVIL